MATRLPSAGVDKSAAKIQAAFRSHQARLRLKKQAAWKMHEKLEYASEQTESKLKDMFDRLLKASETLSPSVAKLLQKAGLPVEEKELLKSTNPDSIPVESSYRGPRIDGPITRKTLVDLIEAFQQGQNGLPSTDNPYIFNGDFVDRGHNSVEVILLLMTSLVLYPSSVFLNRGNHEDIMVTVRYGFQNEVIQKYSARKGPIIDLFKDIFSWLPIYSYVETGAAKIIIIHGGISDKINLKQINALTRNRYVSIEVPPESRGGGKRLTPEEDNEYRQIQDLYWSDPDPQGRKGCRKNDDRNIATFFGADTTRDFLAKYNLSMIIRSHQVKPEGYEYTHDRKVLTVFSASNYSKGSNWGAIVRWDYNEPEPWIISYKTEPVEMGKLSFNKQVTLFEDPAYHSLAEKLMTNKNLLLKEFQNADTNQTNHLSLTAWSQIMSSVLQVDLPWLVLRKKLVEEDEQGILYDTLFDGYQLD
ncbi:unnamed protein product, partial [Rotaria socialis]